MRHGALEHARVVEQVDTAPVGDSRNDGPRDGVEGFLPVERAGQDLPRVREQLEAMVGNAMRGARRRWFGVGR
jgi:hypothetical protein